VFVPSPRLCPTCTLCLAQLPANRRIATMVNKNQKKTAKKQKASETEEPQTNITDYAQLQSEELEALQAIYIDEFEEVEVKGAWSKSTDKAFRLNLKASDPEISVVLSVRLTATYPKTAPILSVEKYHEVRDVAQQAIAKVVENRVKELLGEVMIFEISSAIQDILEVCSFLDILLIGKAMHMCEESRCLQTTVHDTTFFADYITP
jgi:hypothetical protein